jgi:N-acetylglucosamine-6-phosphate deacetylase
MTELTAYSGARIFDGEAWHDNAALFVDGAYVHSIGPAPQGAAHVVLDGGYLVPGFVDLQVNGGGGHLIGEGTGVAELALVCNTHARFGVTSLLPTLITNTPEVTQVVLSAGAAATRQRMPGFLGLHLEGPHLAVSRKGAHDPNLIRPMEESDLVVLERARAELPHLLVTVATESCTPEQIHRLTQAGIVVSLGHTDATFEAASAAIRAGASMATHLFNAMSQMGNREPGLVGAALHHGAVSAGLIADGIHVHPATLTAALRAKQSPGQIFLVSDSMSQAGTDLTQFDLGGRTVYRREGALRLGDGTLAGADLTMDAAVRKLVELEFDLSAALKMATQAPGRAVGGEVVGRLAPGLPADIGYLSKRLAVSDVWRRGAPMDRP